MRDGCVFCDYDGPSPILAELHGDVIIFEPIDPVTPGHVLVVPRVHVPDIAADARVSTAVFGSSLAWVRSQGIEAYNLIVNTGALASQTVFHLHLHVIPRREGDGLILPWTYA